MSRQTSVVKGKVKPFARRRETQEKEGKIYEQIGCGEIDGISGFADR